MQAICCFVLQDMFYNMLPRRRAFKPGPEEHNLLLDVVQRSAGILLLQSSALCDLAAQLT